jgi:hypothetical protein
MPVSGSPPGKPVGELDGIETVKFLRVSFVEGFVIGKNLMVCDKGGNILCQFYFAAGRKGTTMWLQRKYLHGEEAFVSGFMPSCKTRLWGMQDNRNGLWFDVVANFGRTNF